MNRRLWLGIFFCATSAFATTTLPIVTYGTLQGDPILNRPNQVRFLEGPLEEFCRPTPDVVYVEDKLGIPLSTALNQVASPDDQLTLVNTHGVAPNYPLIGYFMQATKALAKTVPNNDAPAEGLVPGSAVIDPVVKNKRKAFLITCHAGHCDYNRGDCVGTECGPNDTASQTAPGWRKLVPLYCDAIGSGNCTLWEKFDVNHDGEMDPGEMQKYFDAVTPQQHVQWLRDPLKNMDIEKKAFADTCRKLPNGKPTFTEMGFGYELGYRATPLAQKQYDAWLFHNRGDFKRLPVCPTEAQAKQMWAHLYKSAKRTRLGMENCDDSLATLQENSSIARAFGCTYLDSAMNVCDDRKCLQRLARRYPIGTRDCFFHRGPEPMPVVRALCQWEGTGLGLSPFQNYLYLPPDKNNVNAQLSRSLPQAKSLRLSFRKCKARYDTKLGLLPHENKLDEPHELTTH